MKSIKFRLNLNEVCDSEESDFEYLATQNPTNPASTIVTWVELGQLHKVLYDTTQVEKYLNNRIWIRV